MTSETKAVPVSGVTSFHKAELCFMGCRMTPCSPVLLVASETTLGEAVVTLQIVNVFSSFNDCYVAVLKSYSKP